MNAFPTIMSQVFKQAGLKTPFLDDYVGRREELFQELCTPALDRVTLKGLFLTSLHGGNYRHKVQGSLPFLERFQSELKACTQSLLDASGYADLKAQVEQKTNPLGSAIALISQINESRIMAAKTTFTQRFCQVATDLFDGQLREIGALDLDACSKFVEEKTGFKMMFVTKPGTNTWEQPKRCFLLPTPTSVSPTPLTTVTPELLHIIHCHLCHLLHHHIWLPFCESSGRDFSSGYCSDSL